MSAVIEAALRNLDPVNLQASQTSVGFARNRRERGQTWGQCVRTDPFTLSLHKYLYCGANPINHIDPTGHEGEGGVTGELGATLVQTIVAVATLGAISGVFITNSMIQQIAE